MSSTKVLTVVMGTSMISSGNGPVVLWFRYTRKVAMSEPKNMHSEARKVHMRSFL